MYRIGIDLGGTNIAVGVVNERHEIVSHTSVPTLAHRSPEAVIADMGHAVRAALDQAGVTAADCASIGVGSPGTCDSDRGVVVRAYNLGWYEVPVCQMLTERFGIPARLSNDANCAALAEYVAGAGCRNMVLITLGTGVGGGIIIDGKIYAGMRSAGAELGHTVLVLDGEPCTCGRRGCWEAYASATALIRQTGQAALAHPESLLASIPAQDINGRTAFDAAEQGDAAARAVVARYCEYVAAGLTDLVNALAPERILLGGGISRQGESLLGPVREYVAAHCFGQRQGAIPVIAEAKLGNEAGIIGAAAL